MKLTINSITIEGTPEECVKYQELMKKKPSPKKEARSMLELCANNGIGSIRVNVSELIRTMIADLNGVSMQDLIAKVQAKAPVVKGKQVYATTYNLNARKQIKQVNGLWYLAA